MQRKFMGVPSTFGRHCMYIKVKEKFRNIHSQLIFASATKSKMKRKQKCGNDKRNENKKKALVAAALAPGQKSLVGMFSQQTVKPSSSISKVSIEAHEVVHVWEEKFASSSKEKNEQNDKQNEIKQPESKEGEANSMWYKGEET